MSMGEAPKSQGFKTVFPKDSIARPLKAGRGGPIQLHDTRPAAMAQSRQQLKLMALAE